MSAVRAMRPDEQAGFAALLAQCAKEPARFTVQSAESLFKSGELEAHKKYLAEQGARYADRLNDRATAERDRIRKVSGDKAAKKFEAFALGLQTADRFVSKPDTVSEWQVPPDVIPIPRTGTGIHLGASNTLKSFGELWIADQVNQHGGEAVLVLGEGSLGFKRRLRAFAKHYGRALKELPAILPFAVDLSDADSVVGFIGALKVLHPQVTYIGFDSKWRMSGNLEENSATDQAKLFTHVDLIARTFNCFCMFIAHVGKSPEKGVRGSSSQYAAVDVELTQERQGDYCTMTATKLKDYEDSTAYTFKVVTVDLGRNAAGDAETSLVLEPVEAADVAAAKSPKGKYEKPIWDCAQSMGERFTLEKLVADATAALRKTDPKVLPKNVRRTLKTMIGDYFTQYGDELTLRAQLVHDNDAWLKG